MDEGLVPRAPASYDEAIEMLKACVARLEQGDLQLEAMRALVGECDRLIRYCHGQLRAVREDVERVTEEWSRLD